MTPGQPDATVVRRHLLALDEATADGTMTSPVFSSSPRASASDR